MLKARLLILSLVVCFLVSCRPIDLLNPFFTDKDVIFDPALLGSWEADGTTFKFMQAGENSYQLILSTRENDELKEAIYSVHLVNLQGQHFLDLTPETWSASQEWSAVPFTRTSGSSAPPRFVEMTDGVYLEFTGNPADNGNSQVKMRVRPMHWILKVAIDGKALQLSYLDDDWLAKAMEERGIRLDHVMVGPGNQQTMLITASTADLQRFVLEHSDDEGAFVASEKIKRIE
jgi:hypothetical protein